MPETNSASELTSIFSVSGTLSANDILVQESETVRLEVGTSYYFPTTVADGARVDVDYIAVPNTRIHNLNGLEWGLYTQGRTYSPVVSGDHAIGLIKDNRSGASVDYALNVYSYEDDYLETNATTGLLEPGVPLQGVIEVDGDVDRFRLSVEAGGTYRVAMEGVSLREGLLLGVFDAEGNRVANGFGNYYANTVAEGWTDFVATETRDVFVAVTNARPSGDTGDMLNGSYLVTVSEQLDDFSNGTDTTGVLPIDGQVTGEIEVLGDVDWFVVELEARQGYVINFEGAASGMGTLRNPYLWGLYNSEGVYTGGADGSSGLGSNSRSFVSVDQSGTYYVSTAAYPNSHAGTYTLSIDQFEDDFGDSAATAGTLVPGATITGAIEYAYLPGIGADYDWFSVSVEAGTMYRFEVSAPSDPSVPAATPTIYGLYDSNGSRFTSLSAPIQQFSATEDGTIFVSVRDIRNDVGQYNLAANVVYTASEAELASWGVGEAIRPVNLSDYYILRDSVGSLGREIFAGTERAEIIRGLAGADTIVGGGGDDVLVGDDAISPDHLISDGARIYRAYDAILGRAPDAQGLDYHVSQGDSLSPWQLAFNLINSAEFSRAHGTLSNSEFVDLMYINLRGEGGAGDDPARDQMIAQLDSGYEREYIAQVVFDSPELRNRLDGADFQNMLQDNPAAASDDVFAVYRAVLGRDPDLAGFQNWINAMGNGLDLSGLAERFLSSREFALNGTLDDQGFAEHVLAGLSGDAAGAIDLDTAVALLAGGVDRADFVAAMSILAESSELNTWMRSNGTDDVLVGGTGDNTLYGGLLSDRFVFDPSDGGEQRIMDLEAWDILDLTGFGFADIEGARAAFEQQGEDLMFTEQGVSVFIKDFALSALSDEILMI